MRWSGCGGDRNLFQWALNFREHGFADTFLKHLTAINLRMSTPEIWQWKAGEELKMNQPFVFILEAVRWWKTFNYSSHRYHHLHSPRFRYLHLTTIGWQDNSTESHLMFVYWRMSLSNGKTRDFYFDSSHQQKANWSSCSSEYSCDWIARLAAITWTSG